MASQYGIGVTRNRFELFDSDEDPLEVLKQHEIEKEQRKKKVTGKENSTASKDPVKKQVAIRKGTKDVQSSRTITVKKEAIRANFSQGRVGEIGTGSRDRPTGYVGNKVADDARDEYSDSKFDKSVLRDGNGRSVRVSNRGRGGRGTRPGFESRGKREFERHSGSDKTGVKCVDKKDGAGAYNWDSTKEIVKEIGENGNYEWSEKPEGAVEPEQTPTEQSEDTTVTATENESAREMTLDEWKALRVPKPKPVHNLRKAGEGEDLSRWKKMYVLEKKNFEEEEEEEEYEHCDYPQRVGRQKHLLDIDIRFKDVRTNRGGRGRGMGRGARNISPRDPDKISAIKKEVPKVDNEHEFPSLG